MEEQPFYKALDPISEAVKFLGEFNVWTILIRIFLALLIGTIFGLERSRKRHTAGLRTFSFVSLFSAAAALLDPLPHKAGESTLLLQSGGEKGLK